jgi:hypothetical protein
MSWIFVVLGALFLLDALKMRKRLGAIPKLAPSEEPVSPEHVFLAAPGVVVDEATRRAASAYAREKKLEVLDLVPGDLSALRLWAFLQFVDPARYRADRLRRGITAGHATLVERSVLERSHVATTFPDKVSFILGASALKHFASSASDLAQAPALHEGPNEPAEELAAMRASIGGTATVVVVAIPILLAILALGVMFAGWQGLVALALYQLQPLFAIAGRPVKHLLLATSFRPVLDAIGWVRLVSGGRGATAAETSREKYEDLLAKGTERFFEARRTTCPICNGAGIAPIVETKDFLQCKPGRFVLDRCEGCGHIFQNPRLSIEGLEFYYGDFYDGLGAADAEMLFSSTSKHYVDRAEIVRGHGREEPKRWLDVGGGHGHFCCVARDLWPKTGFDALDLSESIDEAVRRRWVDTGYRGLFPDKAPELEGRYDVVSMSHYLEHTREPEDEIRAASIALGREGLLMIELPDPEFRLGRVLGKFWLPWFQPQHQHFLSVKNLGRLLEENGFEPLVWHRGSAHQPVDFWAGAYLLLSFIAPKADVPWRKRGALGQTLRTVVLTLGTPLMLAGRALDVTLARFVERSKVSNTYRVLAKKRPLHDDRRVSSERARSSHPPEESVPATADRREANQETRYP